MEIALPLGATEMSLAVATITNDSDQCPSWLGQGFLNSTHLLCDLWGALSPSVHTPEVTLRHTQGG